MENAACYAPQILVSTEDLPREQWLEYRRKGIGGSDAAAVAELQVENVLCAQSLSTATHFLTARCLN